MLEFSMIHGDVRRAALQRWLEAQFPGTPFALAPASEDASFRRYFRATLDDGRSFVASLLREAGVHAPQVHAQDFDQGFLLLADLGTRTYLQELSGQDAARNAP